MTVPRIERPRTAYERRLRALASLINPTEIIALGTLFTVCFGMIYCRYYFHRLSFPYQFLDVNTTFYLFRSLQPIAITFSYLVCIGGILLPNSLVRVAVMAVLSWLPSPWKKHLVSHPKFHLCLVPIRGALIIAFFVLGRQALNGLGYDYLPLLVPFPYAIFWFLSAALSGISTGFAVTNWECELRANGDGTVVGEGQLERKLNRLVIAFVLVSSVITALALGKVEAEKLVEGQSRNSMHVTFNFNGLPNGSSEPYILIMVYGDYFYVTEQQEVANLNVELHAISKDEISSYNVERIND